MFSNRTNFEFVEDQENHPKSCTTSSSMWYLSHEKNVVLVDGLYGKIIITYVLD